ncbi:MAG TPA: hypothetical protein VFL60_09060 [Gaiellaceae bacterium]|nr:hypothetical protein [Gaiellaceae bacterium]
MRRTSTLIALAALAVAAAAAAASAAGGLPHLGTPTMQTRPVYRGYYDKHVDTYLIDDVSSRSQARALHVNYAPALKTVKGLPLQYFVRGRAAAGQLTVFGSEPGESDYNPLWEEVFVTWKPGVKPVLLGRDDQIDALAKQGKLTMQDAHVVLNAPILAVGTHR